MEVQEKEQVSLACEELTAWERGIRRTFPPKMVEQMEEKGVLRRCTIPKQLEVEEAKNQGKVKE